ncbi:MAG: right-handed parallel beta-helix repeat-containing protein [Clostridia bacterium]|nr:right-handed parallel beta-helix repeat-containing protein [Clostridia bacterium]
MRSFRKILSVAIAAALLFSAYAVVTAPVSAANELPAGWEFQPMSDVKGICAQQSLSGRPFVQTDYGIAADGSLLVRSDVYSGMAVSTTKKIPFTAANPITATVLIGDMVLDTTTAIGELNESCANTGYGAAPVYGHSINLSDDKSVLSGHGYASKVFYDSGISIKFFMCKTGADAGKIVVYTSANGVSTSNNTYVSGVTFSPADEVTFSFEISGSDVSVYYTKAGGSKTLLNTMSGAAAIFSSGSSYLSFASDSYGNDRTYDMTVKKVNGVPFSTFDGFVKTIDVDSLTPSNADNQGIVTNNGKEISFDFSKGTTPMAGTSLSDKVTVDGLTLSFRASKASVANASYFGIFLSNTKPTAFTASVIGGNHGPNSDKNSTLAITFRGNNPYLDVVSACISELLFENKVLENSTCELKFTKNENGKYTVKLNNVALSYSHNGAVAEFDLSAVVDENGKAYLTFAGMSTVAAGSKATVSKINGFDAAAFSAEKDTAERAGFIVGAQFRSHSAEQKQGLRFLVNLIKNEKYNTIKEAGALIMPTDLLPDTSGLKITESGKINGRSYLRIVAEKYYVNDPAFLQFTAVLTDIPSDKLSRNFTAVGYIIYEGETDSDEDDEIIYTNTLNRSVNYVQRLSSATPADVISLPTMSETASSDYIDMSTVLTPADSAAAAGSYAASNVTNLNSFINSLDSSKDYIFYFKGGYYGLNGAVTFPANVTLMFDEASSLYCLYGTTPVFNCKDIITQGTNQVLYLNVTANTTNFANLAFIRPEWFGAKVNDNVCDASAIKTATYFGIPVLLSEGVYNVNSDITVSNHLSVFGHSEDKTSVIKIGVNTTAFKIVTCTDPTVIGGDRSGSSYFARFDNISFEGITGGACNAIVYNGIHNGVSRVDVFNCSFSNLNTAIFFDYAGGCCFDNLEFNNVNRCIDVGAYSMFIFIRNCNAADSATFVHCDQLETNGVANGIQIDNCTTLRMTYASVFVTKNQTTFVTNCNFNSVGTGCGIYFIDCYDSRIDSNIITYTGTSTAKTVYGINLQRSTGRETVSNNQIIGFPTGIGLSRNGLAARSATFVHANLIKGCSFAGIDFIDLNDAKFIGNVFQGCGYGMNGGNSSGIMICQNRFNGAGTDNSLYAHLGNPSGLIGNNVYGTNE